MLIDIDCFILFYYLIRKLLPCGEKKEKAITKQNIKLDEGLAKQTRSPGDASPKYNLEI